MAKLAFVVLFENIVFGLKAAIQYAVPDVPKCTFPIFNGGISINVELLINRDLIHTPVC